MAILDLQAGQEKVIKDLICKSNPQLLDYPDYFFRALGDVVDHGDGSCSVFLLGDPKDVELQQVSGKVFARYQRVNLAKYFQGVPHKIQLSNPRDVKQLLFHLGEQFGVLIPESMVVNATLAPTASGSILVQLTVPANRSFVFDQTSYTLEWEPAAKVHLYDVLTVSRLPPAPVTIQLNWAELSTDWYVPATNYAVVDYISQLVPSGPYTTTGISAAFNAASRGEVGTWVCENTTAKRNLWNSVIISNAANSAQCGLIKPHRRLVVRGKDASTGGHNDLSIFYSLIDFTAEEFVLPDSETTLRRWLTPLGGNVTSWDTVKAPQLFNVVTGQKFGPWVAENSAVRIRNLWWSGITAHAGGTFIKDDVTYNRKMTWSPNGSYSTTTVGSLVFYYNSLV